MISDGDKARIDKMSLDDMEHVWNTTPSFAWPFKSAEVGDYFCERFERLKAERDDHLADPY